MSIRLRRSGGLTIALCAVEADAADGDTYLDDAQHYALAAKFADDWRGQVVDWRYDEEWAEMAKHKMRDAGEELSKWLAASADTHPKDGDVKQAPRVSGAVPQGDAPNTAAQKDSPDV